MNIEIKTYVTGRNYGTPQVLYYAHIGEHTVMFDPSRNLSYMFDSILTGARLLQEYDYNTGYWHSMLSGFEQKIKAII